MKSFKSYFIAVILASILLNSCIKDEDYRTLEDENKEIQEYLSTNQITTQPAWTGLYYIETEPGTGIIPQFFDTVYIEFNATLLDGSTFASSYDNEGPLTFQLFDNSIIYGLSEALSYMKVGTKARAIIPSSLAYGSYNYDDIKAFTPLIYDIELIAVGPGIPVEPIYTDTLVLNTTSSGLKYYIVKQDTAGDMVKKWDDVTLHYTGYLSNGRIFDSSVKKEEPVTIQAGAGQYIQGWEEGLILMREGEKFRFIIPQDLAYGEYGRYPVIRPNETLIFDIEVIEIQ